MGVLSKTKVSWRGDRAYNKALAIKPDYAEAHIT